MIPASKIILFGSYATGNANTNSDIDFLVIEPEVKERRKEMARLRRTLDLRAIKILITKPEADNEIIGFHAQPFVEKCCKAALLKYSVKIRKEARKNVIEKLVCRNTSK